VIVFNLSSYRVNVFTYSPAILPKLTERGERKRVHRVSGVLSAKPEVRGGSRSRGGASRTFSGHISDDGITDAFVVAHKRRRLPLKTLRRDAARNVETAIVSQGGVAWTRTWCVCHVMRACVARKDTMPYDHGGIMQITEANRPTGASTLAFDATTRRPILPIQGRFLRVLMATAVHLN